MASADLIIRQGDTTPVLTGTVVDQSGNAVNLTGASVLFIMRSMTSGTVTVSAAATITNAAAGAVQYSWQAADTATAGLYQAVFRVTLSGGGTYTWPNDGYLDIWIEENLTSDTSSYLLSVPDMKNHLNIPATDRSQDQKLLRWVMAATSVIEHVTGPIVPKQYDEWYDGGSYGIRFRHRPVIDLIAASIYLGPVEYAMAQVTEPQDGSIFSVMVDGGSQLPFPAGDQTIHLVYTAGYTSTPENVRQAALEMLRENWVATQTPGGPRTGSEALMGPDSMMDHMPLPVMMSSRVREWLLPNRRHPSIV